MRVTPTEPQMTMTHPEPPYRHGKAPAAVSSSMPVGNISATELQARLEGPDPPQVIDIRHPTAYAHGHIPSAENVPFPTLIQEIGSVSWAEQIVVVCPHGESSMQAAQLIDAYAGVSDDAVVLNLTGGYAEWSGTLEDGGDYTN